MNAKPTWQPSRRTFLRASAAAVAALGTGRAWPEATASDEVVRFGLVTDPHYADIATHGTRWYRHSLEKMDECIALMNAERAGFLIELGDFTNGAEKGNTAHLAAIEARFGRFDGPRYHVLGNHDLDSLSKDAVHAVIENTGIARGASHYAFNRGGLHVVVLDACYRADGTPYDTGNFDWTDANIPADQLEWLEADLAENRLPALVCAHQCLEEGDGPIHVRNAAAVRAVLERHPEVLAVFQGHHHAGQQSRVAGIHYYTLRAMVEGEGEDNSAYAVVALHADHTLSVTGYRRAVSASLPAGA